MSKITDVVRALAQPVAEAQNCEIWDVEYVKEAGSRYLRVYIDKADGVSIQDCEQFSRALDPILDSYSFEGSPAGAERVLKLPGVFPRFLGEQVEVRLYQPQNGSKTFVGTLKAYENGDVTVAAGSEEKVFAKSTVAQVRLHMTI